MWAVGLKNDNEGEITRYSLVLNWTEELKRKMRGLRGVHGRGRKRSVSLRSSEMVVANIGSRPSQRRSA